MATVACAGCGLPRVESELGSRPCPVCDAVPLAPAVPRAKPRSDAGPTAGMPADASELYAPGAPAPTRAPATGSRFGFVAVVFLFGALVGVGGVLGVQAIDRLKAAPGEPEAAAKPNDAPAPLPAIPPSAPAVGPQLPLAKLPPAVAPMPHEPGTHVVVVDPDPDPDPEAKPLQAPPPPGRVTTFELNQPDAVFSVPFPMKKGEHVVIKGKVKTLKVSGLDGGAFLDASGLEAATVYVGGKIDNRSKLRVKAPAGTVTVAAKIDGKSVVEIDAPGGEVKFSTATTPTREGSKIDNGSTLTITARVLEFKGDITGTDTKVSVTLTRNAWLKVASVSGKATVEYKSQVAGWSPPDVIVGSVAPGATFRKVE